MTNELYISEAPPRPSLPAVLWMIAWPFFLFCAVLSCLLALSWTLLLPRYTQIDVGGQLRSAADIKQYQTQLNTEIAAKEDERQRLVLAVHDPAYTALKDERRSRMPLDTLQKQLATDAATATGKDDIVQWSAFTYDGDAKTLTAIGDVRNVGVRSMTVLAELVASFKGLPFVASVTTPSFTRMDDPDIGVHSPFTVTFSLTQ